MLTFYKIILAPILLMQGRRLRQTALRLPEAAGARQGLEQGGSTNQTPLRLLVLGDSSAAGVGVAQQAQALAQPLARMLSAKLDRPISWQLLAKSGINTAEAYAFQAENDLQPADVIVTALGVNDVSSQQSPQQFLRHYQSLIGEVQARTGAAMLVATGVPPMGLMPALPQPLRWYLGRYAARLDAHLQQWLSRHPLSRYVSLTKVVNPADMAQDGFHPGAAQYRLWTELLAEQISSLPAAL